MSAVVASAEEVLDVLVIKSLVIGALTVLNVKAETLQNSSDI